MAVRVQRRGEGSGRRLLAVAEKEALVRGCHWAYVDTVQYQAPTLYQRCGYEIAGTLPDWDSHGRAKYLLTKALN